ncbi:MAG TPA: hypothetical protein DEP35_13725, partial [Deltaproteobacteria bacterium]|nr:hypothetical protein [Deltaproteobacteria bacterium]
MKRFTLVIVPEGIGQVRRFGVSERDLKRLLVIGAAAGLVFLLCFAHYLILRGQMAEFTRVRAEAEHVRAEAEAVRAELQSRAEERQHVADDLARIQEFERRVRVIANLPRTGVERTAEEPASPRVRHAAKRGRHATPPIDTPAAAST